MAIKVKLRTKPISGNRLSLYLDFYPAIIHPETGIQTRREFLRMEIFNEFEVREEIYFDSNKKEQKRFVQVLDKKGNPKKVKLHPLDKQHNEETLQTAEQIRQKRESRLNKPEIYTGYEIEQLKKKEQGEKNFVEYFKALVNKRDGTNKNNWVSAFRYFDTFVKGNLKFADLNESLCNDFKEYLLNTISNKSSKATLSQNSALSYFNKLKATLKQAYKDGLLQTDLNKKVEPVKEVETQRRFLTLEELNSLVKTDCQDETLKRAALFSALTGLRFSDIKKMIWSEVEFIEGDGFYVQFKQQKTGGVEMMPISEQAFSLMGERRQPSEQVFEGLKYSAYHNKYLYQWIGAAGITKYITFHCFRHTYATLQLSKGTDIYTVSKMLGHRELKTTQIYAKIINQTKRDATDKIKLDF